MRFYPIPIHHIMSHYVTSYYLYCRVPHFISISYVSHLPCPVTSYSSAWSLAYCDCCLPIYYMLAFSLLNSSCPQVHRSCTARWRRLARYPSTRSRAITPSKHCRNIRRGYTIKTHAMTFNLTCCNYIASVLTYLFTCRLNLLWRPLQCRRKPSPIFWGLSDALTQQLE